MVEPVRPEARRAARARGPWWPTGALVGVLAGSAVLVPLAGAATWRLALLAIAVAWVIDASRLRAPAVERVVPTELVRGVAVGLRVVVAARPGVRVRVRQPQTADLRVSPAESEDVLAAELTPRRRGRHVLPPVVVRYTGPLRLARRDHEAGGELEVAVHADLPGARRLALAVQRGTFRDPGHRRGPIGLGTEFDRIREYADGDDVRRLNWAATARVGRPMVNQHREDTERTVWCLVDAGRLSASPVGDRTRLDLALDAVAAVAATAEALGDRVGAVAYDERVRRTVPPRRGGAATLVRALDDVEPEIVDSDHEAAYAQVSGTKRSLVVAFTDLLDEAAARPLLDAVPVLVRRHAVLVVSPADPELVTAVTRPPGDRRSLLVASAAAGLLAEQDRIDARLRGAGAQVIEPLADQLPAACVGAYLRLKAQARL